MALYNDVVNIAKNYLGLAAEEYIQRRARISCSIDAKDLEKGHLKKLADSIGISATAYISEEKVKEFVDEIMELGVRSTE